MKQTTGGEYMSTETVKSEDIIAYFRYTVILPLVEAAPGTIRTTASELSKKVFNDPYTMCSRTFGERTIFTYYSNFKKHGFNGLKPKVRAKSPPHPSISPDILKHILKLKEDLPTRSAEKIISMLTLSMKVQKGSLHPRTINRALKFYGYTRENLKKDSRVYTKHEKAAINIMWQSDVMEAFFIPDENGNQRMVYLIGFIDDHSRRILHCQFYFDATLTRLEDCLKKAVIKFGSPSSLYVDNGKIFVSDNFKIICAKLGINLKYSTPYKPSGKGKIEKYWEYVQNSFVSEIRKTKVSSIIELNDILGGWLENEYHNRIHKGTGEIPTERWKNSLTAGTKLNFFSPVEIDNIFLHETVRTVNKYGVVSFEGNTYEIDGVLVNKKVTLRYNPFQLDVLHIYYDDKYFGLAGVIDLNVKKHKSVKNIVEDPCVDSEISKQYLDALKSNYQEYLRDQLDLLVSKDIIGPTARDTNTTNVPTDENIFRAPKDKEVSIERNEFIEIVLSQLPFEHFTFAEKGKLYEFYDTFKDFDKDILTAILTDIKNKTPDFNKSFLFYLATLKTLYNEEIEKMNAKNGRKNYEHKD